MSYFVYIISNTKHKPFYTGVTNSLERRIYEHKNKIFPESFSAKYNLDKLLFWEEHSDIITAINREKQLKKWKQEYKLELIKAINPSLCDLSLLPYYLDRGQARDDTEF